MSWISFLPDLLDKTRTETTEVIYGSDRTLKFVLGGLSRLQWNHNVCLDSQGLSVIVADETVKNAYADLKKRGVMVCIITEITRENIPYCKEAMKFAELRHLDGIRGNFSVSDGREYTAVATVEEAKPLEQLIYSNVKAVAKQQQYFFETLWDKATPAELRINAVLEGTEPARIEIISDLEESVKRGTTLVQKAKEIQVLFATASTFERGVRMGIFELYKQATTQNRAKIHLLIPQGENTETLIAKLKAEVPEVEARVSTLQTNISIMTIDKRELMVWEEKSGENSPDPNVGLITYSNSQSIVSSFVAIFDNLWMQTELYEQIKQSSQRLTDAYAQLEAQDKLQKEFINIAAHELRTPIQPILGLSELIELGAEKLDDDRVVITTNELEMIVRNARRLERLARDILELARVESQGIILNLEKFNLHDILSSVITDARHQIRENGSNVDLSYDSQDILVVADRGRLMQVLSNLLSNAICFTTEGNIRIDAKRMFDDSGENIVISVHDTGKGIDPDILPRLFSKFVTNSSKGTGLGLYISKKIIKSHGGSIGGKNNENGRGATFTFSIPVKVGD
jgi:two-component system sensor histidine kinase VicK